jgi:rubredoxin
VNIILNTDPFPNLPPEKTVTAKPAQPEARSQPSAVPFLAHLPKNACDVIGCKKYGQTFPNPQALADHKRAVHAPPPPKAQPKVITPPPTQPIMETHPAKVTSAHLLPAPGKFKCRTCGLPFDAVWELSAHVRTAHPEHVKRKKAGAFRCPECEFGGLNRSGLGKHFSTSHPGKILRIPTDTFECGACGHTGETEKAIKYHALSCHGTSAGMVRSRSTSPAAPPAPQPLPAPAEPLHERKAPSPDPRPTFTLTFTGTKADCGNVAMLLLQHGYNHLTTGEK